jgi:hypothetical protein
VSWELNEISSRESVTTFFNKLVACPNTLTVIQQLLEWTIRQKDYIIINLYQWRWAFGNSD